MGATTRAAAAALLAAATACAGDQHRSDGHHRLAMTGGLSARVAGAAHAEYAHRFSSSGPGFTIGLQIPAGHRLFPPVLPGEGPTPGADTDFGRLVFTLDSLPEPGTYAPRPVTWRTPGVRAERTVRVLLISSSGAHMWDPIGGEIRFARTPATRDGLRAAFRLRLVRAHGGPPDTAVVTGSFETR